MSARTTRHLSAFAVLMLVAVSCSADESTTADRRESPAIASPTPQPSDGGGQGGGEAGQGGGGQEGSGAPAEVRSFSAPRLGGGTIDGEDYSGRDVAFWFWAPW